MEPPNDQYDCPWKEAIEHYFPEFLSFYFPDAYRHVDWSKGREESGQWAVGSGQWAVGSGQWGRYSYRTILCDMNNVPLRGLNSSINL